MTLKEKLANLIEGEAMEDDDTLKAYSRDTSLFEVRPKVVISPRTVEDVRNIIRFVAGQKESSPGLSVTGRSAGSDMSGGPLNESIIFDFTKHFTHFTLNKNTLSATVNPGVYYREFEKEILPEHLSLPCYPASKDLAALGGMIMNNSAGEKSLRYGQMREFVTSLNVVLADGNEYILRPLDRSELDKKMSQQDYEGRIYRQMYDLIEQNYELIQSAKPRVSKNASGYALWRVWDRERFDLAQLFVGSQGTLGILVDASIRVIRDTPYRKMITVFFKNWDPLPQVVNALTPANPEGLEVFDDATLKLGIKFMPEIAKKAGSSFIPFALKFLPEIWAGMRMLGFPKLILLAEFAEDSKDALKQKVRDARAALKKFDVYARIVHTAEEEEKYWVMRHESFNLLRKHVRGKHTAPFIEDFCVDPELIPEFLPKLLVILKENGIKANIAGHAGSGNYHIIPLMNLNDPGEIEKIPRVADIVYNLIIEYGGTITAEHNDGIIRTPYIEKMFGEEVYELFKRVKNIFDPQNIFNPGKKVSLSPPGSGTKEYIKNHIAQ